MNRQEKKERELMKPIFWFAMWMLFACVWLVVSFSL